MCVRERMCAISECVCVRERMCAISEGVVCEGEDVCYK